MKSVRAKLTLFTIMLVALAIGATGLLVSLRVRANLMAELDRQLEQVVAEAKLGAPSEGFPPTGPPPEVPASVGAPGALQDRQLEFLRSDQDQVTLNLSTTEPRLLPVDPDGSFRPGPVADDPAGAEAALKAGNEFHDYAGSLGPMRSLSRRIQGHGKVLAVVQASRPLGPVQHQVADLNRALAMTIPIALIIAAISGAALIGGAMRPLRKLADAAQHLDADLSGSRLPAQGSDEFAELAKTFNAAFDRTAAAFAQLERFTGDAGHELRTPIAAIKSNSSYLLHLADLPPESREAVTSIDRSADRMARLVDDLLLLARHDAGKLEPVWEPVQIEPLLQEVVDQLGSPEVEVCIESGRTFTGDPDAVRRVAANLISNAVRYAQSHVKVRVRLEGDLLTLSVSDDGSGIAPEHLARLGERFYRADSARARDSGGFGLGLAIVKELCAAHGGALTLESRPGTGTTASATLRVRP